MGARPPRTTLPARYKRAQNVVENVRKSDLLKLNLYRLLPLDARFEKLMRLYDSISDWKKEYKKVEMRKPAAVRTPLNVENIEDVIDGAIADLYFAIGDEVQFFAPDIETFNFKINKIYNEAFEEIDVARHPRMIVKLEVPIPLSKDSFMRLKTFDKKDFL